MKGFDVIEIPGQTIPQGELRNSVYTFFKKSLTDGNEWFRAIDPQAFQDAYTAVIDSILARPETVVKFAVIPQEVGTWLGWSICEGTTLHYVFVKTGIGARQHGIATALMPEKIDTITHLTKVGREIWRKKYPNAKFNPFK